MFLLVLVMVACGLSGCRKPLPPEPDYARPLPPGAFGLRRLLDQNQWPDLAPVIRQHRDPRFREAAQRSLRWFSYPSSQAHFPVGPISLTSAGSRASGKRACNVQVSASFWAINVPLGD